jgi:ABC-type branched-subunit amino acid transport system ATPase component/ABC-type branched-subunit amino acid transport system permease subunit
VIVTTPVELPGVLPSLNRYRLLVASVIIAILVFPLLVPFSVLGSVNLGASYALVAVALVVLTGWVGQISLGHAAFVGVGAYTAGWAGTALGLPFPLSAPFAGLTGAVAALVLGMVALRVRGLYLAVATLIFSWMADAFLFRQKWLTAYFSVPTTHIGGESRLISFDLSSRRTIYYIAWSLVAVSLIVVANMRDSKTGRAFFAVRGSEVAAASLGIDVIRVKLLGFAVSGALAGLAGAVIMGDARVVSPDQFSFNASLFYLAIAVVGGVRSLPGAIGSAILFASLTELFFRVEALGGYLEVVSATLLVVVLLVGRGGLAAFATDIRDRVRPRRSDDDVSPETPTPASVAPAEAGGRSSRRQARAEARAKAVTAFAPSAVEPRPPAEAVPVLHADNVVVEFGGLRAVDGVTVRVDEGQIVGLIGPNGAGKTVTFNSIAGLVRPTSGRILLHGVDVTDMAVHQRARLGVARTFQMIQLFPQLTVFENLLVATNNENPSGVVDHILVTPKSLREEARARQHVRDVIGRLGLQQFVDRRVGDLPFGVLRMVEVARALVTGFRFVMLDEPASGLDNRETDNLVALLRELHADGMSLLLIEHDVKMVTSVCDYMFVLDRGKPIASGPPEKVARDPAVIKAYLGQEPAGLQEVVA